MATMLANPVDMIRQGAPHVIHSDAELAQYTAVLFDLTGNPKPTKLEKEAIELLTVLINRYESQRYPMPDVGPAEMLQFLLEQSGLSQRDIAKDLGHESTVSLVLSGNRPLTRDHIERLSKRFHVSPAVFFPRVA